MKQQYEIAQIYQRGGIVTRTHTAKGHHQQEGRPPRGRRIQAASLISKGLPIGHQGQIGALVPYGAHDNY
jgi:hypothetical protein